MATAWSTGRDFNFMPERSALLRPHSVGAGGDPTGRPTARRGATVTLVPTVTPRPGRHRPGTPRRAATSNGFGLYVNGERYIFQLTGGALPPAGTQWTLRTYTGVVEAAAGSAAAGTLRRATPTGYAFTPAVRSPAIAGLQIKFTVTQPTSAVATTNLDLTQGAHGAGSVLRDERVRGHDGSEDPPVREPADPGDHPHLHVERHPGARCWSTTRPTTAEPKTWNLRNRNNQVVAIGCVLLYDRSRRRPQGRPLYGRELRPVVHWPGEWGPERGPTAYLRRSKDHA